MEKGSRINHILDKWIGIPIVVFLGLLKKKNRTVPASIDRIAILNIGSIGDNVLMSAVLCDLRSQYPNANISAFTGGTNYYIVQLIQGIDRIIQLPITNPINAVKIIRESGAWDVLFDFGPWPRLNAIYSFFFKAKCKVGFITAGQFRHYVYDIKISHSSQIHEIENHRNLVRSFYKGTSHFPSLRIVEDAGIKALIQKLGKYCIIHPWPGGYKSYMKQWADAKWVQLIERIKNDYDYIVLTGAPSDVKKSAELYSMIQRVAVCEKVMDVAGKYSLSQMVFLIRHASKVISIDTGIAHISAALHKPQICIQGPANSKRWAPYNSNTRVVIPSKGTFGYLSYGYEYDRARGNCMNNISVEQVYQAVKINQEE
jgi:ADP-heptose:LPS heptosyltransferase